MRKIVMLLITILITATSLEARVVLNGTPDTRATADEESVRREVLTPELRADSHVIIIWDGESYRWATRENRVLIHNNSGGPFHYFIDPQGGGWIKVMDCRATNRQYLEMVIDCRANVQYLENVSSFFLSTITYWGTASEFNP